MLESEVKFNEVKFNELLTSCPALINELRLVNFSASKDPSEYLYVPTSMYISVHLHPLVHPTLTET